MLELLNIESKANPSPEDYREAGIDFTALKIVPQETSNIDSISVGFQELRFDDPIDFLYVFDPDIREGRVNLYEWQIKKLRQLSHKYTRANPFIDIMVAVNGSGKDKYIIAPLLSWKLTCSRKSFSVVTTSSGTQLDTQTEPHTRRLLSNVNKALGGELVKLNYRHFSMPSMGSEVKFFATDEGTRAEGYHPIEYNTELLIIANEAKSIAPEIWEGLHRCEGYNIWLEISSAGEPSGHFYYSVTCGKYPVTIILANDCGHINNNTLERVRDEFGEDSPLYQSMKNSVFVSKETEVIIPLAELNILLELIKQNKISWIFQDHLTNGTDLSRGGDETTSYTFRGNKFVASKCFNIKNTETTAFLLADFYEKCGLKAVDIYADDGGVGAAIIDKLEGLGWLGINRIHNQGAPTNKNYFKNLGAQNWWKVRNFIESGSLILPVNDPVLIEQLSRRHYSTDENKIKLLKKAEEKANGIKSPDRGDGVVLAFVPYSKDDFEKARTRLKNSSKVISIPGNYPSKPTPVTLPNTRNNRRYDNTIKYGHCHFSITRLQEAYKNRYYGPKPTI